MEDEHVEIMIPSSKVGVIIGKLGRQIIWLQEQSGTRMVLFQNDLKDRNGRPLHIYGDPQKIEHAKQLVYDLIVETEVCVAVTNSAVDIINSKYDERIRRIQNETSVRIQFQQGRDNHPEERMCKLTGTRNQIEKARKRIDTLFEHAKELDIQVRRGRTGGSEGGSSANRVLYGPNPGSVSSTGGTSRECPGVRRSEGPIIGMAHKGQDKVDHFGIVTNQGSEDQAASASPAAASSHSYHVPVDSAKGKAVRVADKPILEEPSMSASPSVVSWNPFYIAAESGAQKASRIAHKPRFHLEQSPSRAISKSPGLQKKVATEKSNSERPAASASPAAASSHSFHEPVNSAKGKAVRVADKPIPEEPSMSASPSVVSWNPFYITAESSVQKAPRIAHKPRFHLEQPLSQAILKSHGLQKEVATEKSNSENQAVSASSAAASSHSSHVRVNTAKGKAIRVRVADKPILDLNWSPPPSTGCAERNSLEERRITEPYENYMPTKVELGLPHPDPVVESASLASVAPPDVEYVLHLPEAVIADRSLSALQLEAIIYCCQRHEQNLPNGSRAGFLIGDGAGVGKGRTISGIILENFLQGRQKAIWISSSTGLIDDAQRDLRDIKAEIPVHGLNKFESAKILEDSTGSIKKGVIFASYHCLIGESRSGGEDLSRVQQLLQWCEEDFDGVIVFDECHRAKGLVPSGSTKPTKTGLTVLELQNKLPKARIVYASATAASEPRNMAYMVRLGLWGKCTPFKEFSNFIGAVEKRGVGAMEIVAMEMKHRGMYIARQLSFKDITFKVEEVALTPKFIKSYDDSVKLWNTMLESFTKSADLVKADRKSRKIMWAQFWSAHQRFFKYLCIAAKVRHAVKLTNEAVKEEKCVVIGLQSTGESRTLEQIENKGELSDFVSTAKGVVQALFDNHFPVEVLHLHELGIVASHPDQLGIDTEFCGEGSETSGAKRKDAGEIDRIYKRKRFSENDPSDGEEEDQYNAFKKPLDKSSVIKERLLAQLEEVDLPPNTLDQLIDELGGPTNVAEMTGRKGRVVRNDNGQIQYESRSKVDTPSENLNILEKACFMTGKKNVAVISEAASSGYSLHADSRANNQRRRVHITLELPWGADRAIQQFGRTHRSNQVSAPEYIFLISDLAGERRFASIVARRLESLGALTHGDRRATESRDLSQFNIDTKYGRAALEATMKAVMGYEVPDVPPPADYKGEFFKDMKVALVSVGLICNSETNPGELILDRDYANISRFLNRILGMSVDLQNRLFKYFSDTLAGIINQEKKSGRFDMGILDLVSDQDDVRRTKLDSFTSLHPTGTDKIDLHTFEVERGMSWEVASEKYTVLFGAHEGFYVSKENKFVSPTAVLVVQSGTGVRRGPEKGESLYSILRPNTGLDCKEKKLEDIVAEYVLVEPRQAKIIWINQYESSLNECIHKFRFGFCENDCERGRRLHTYNVLSGSVLSVWTKVESLLSGKMQVVRVLSKGKRCVGILVPSPCIPHVKKLLSVTFKEVTAVLLQ